MYIIEYIGSHPPLSNCQNARMVLEDNHQLRTPSLSVGHGVISQRANRWFSTHVKLAATIQSSHGNSLSIMSHEVFDLSPYHLSIRIYPPKMIGFDMYSLLTPSSASMLFWDFPVWTMQLLGYPHFKPWKNYAWVCQHLLTVNRGDLKPTGWCPQL